jgi:hypothetical protein
VNITVLFILTNLASGFLGWLFGRIGRDSAKVAAAVEEAVEEKADGSVHRPFRWMIIAFMLICGLTAANGIYISIRQSNFSECAVGQFDKLLDALDARFNSSREATLQLDAVFVTIVNAYTAPTPDAADKVRKAIFDYAKLRREAEDVLKKNPYPEPPRNACRE